MEIHSLDTQTHDVAGTVEWIRKQRERLGNKQPWDGVLDAAKRIEVTRELTTRPHTFTCGTEGEVVDELVVKFKFPKGELDIQPHTAFAENSVNHFLVSFIDSELHGWIENIHEH